VKYVLYGGKGGVGKTTCAGAHAVAAAAAAQRVLVVSTDPAHSLGDALGMRLTSTPRVVRRRLDAAELDAPRAFRRWMAANRRALVDIVEQGSWLDREDAAALVSLPVPGVDELVGLIGIMRLARERRPDLVIVDISMPGLDGIEATRRLQAMAPGLRVLILSIHVDPEYVQAAFAAGACGYLTKTSSPEEIERAVREVLAGHFYVSSEIARAAVLPAARPESPPPPAAVTLTQRELDILRLVAEGLGNQQIARRLGVSVTTVRSHLNSLYGKLRLKNRVELALYASQAGAVAPRPGAK